jgi:hypothetical protein
LGVRNTETKRLARLELRTLLSKELIYKNLSRKVSEGELTNYLNDLKDLLYDMRPVLEDTDRMLEYSNVAINLPQTQLD